MRRRSRRRTRSTITYLLVGIIVSSILIIGVFGIFGPTASFQSSKLTRPENIDVVDDGKAILSLNITGSVVIGDTERLVTSTNPLQQNITVTVSLTDGSSDYGTLLIDGENVGDSTTFTLKPDESTTIDMRVDCDEDIVDNKVQFTVNASTETFVGTIIRHVPIQDSNCTDPSIVYATSSSHELRRIIKGEKIIKFDTAKVEALGPRKISLDGDSRKEIPYVTANSYLRIIDRTNETQTLVDKSTVKPKQDTHLGVGYWEGHNASVFFAGANNNYLWRVEMGEEPHIIYKDIATETNPIEALSVVGIGDINGDGDTDIVYVAPDQTIKYIETDHTTETRSVHSLGITLNTHYAVGDLANIESIDSEIEYPYNNGDSPYIRIGNISGLDETVSDGSLSAKETPLALADWNTDDKLDIIFIGSSGYLKYITLSGEVGYVRTESGSKIKPYPEAGPA